jgi:hypothetical protein
MFSLVLDCPAVGAARLRLGGHLDEVAAREVLRAAADVVAGGCSRLVVDLSGLQSYDAQAAYALVGCTRLARFLPEGVAVVGDGAAPRALAAAAGVVLEEGIMALCPAS